MIRYFCKYARAYGVWLSFSILSILYLIIQWNRFFLINASSPYDDSLQYLLSKNIVEGRWLGKYNNVTLAKGAIFPLWTALLHIAHIPLWLGDNLLYIIACAGVVYATRYFIPKRWLALVLYGGLLFDPIISPRAYRDAIAPAIILFVFVWLIGMFSLCTTGFKGRTVSRDVIIYTLFGIIGLPSWYYLREDYFWIVPSMCIIIIFSFLYFLYSIKWKIRKKYISIAIIAIAFILPILSVKIVGFEISSLNKRHYGRSVVNDYTSSDFTNAYAALNRVDNNKPKPLTVPVTQYMRKQLYKEVPSFKKLEPCLDGPSGKCEIFEYGSNSVIVHDYEGGWFPWALRMAVQDAGYYQNAGTTATYYKNLNNEINIACKSHALSCHAVRTVDLTPLPTRADIRPLLLNFKNASLYVLLLRRDDGTGAYYTPSHTTSPDQYVIAQYYHVRYATANLGPAGVLRIKALRIIANIYRYLNPVLLCLSILIFIASTIKLVKHRGNIDWRVITLGWMLIGSVIFRYALLAYVQTVSFPAINGSYLSSAYLLMFLFEGLALILIYNRFRS
jgi:hypothetical protein